MTQAVRPPHVQRCAHAEVRGGTAWQCLLQDPHPGQLHRYPIDAEFGRDLDRQTPIWLAATLRDQTALRLHTQDRVDELQAIAIELSTLCSRGGVGELTQAAADWVRKNNPTAAARMGIE